MKTIYSFFLVIFLLISSSVSAQVKNMIDGNDIKMKLTTKYNKLARLPVNNVELTDDLGAIPDDDCALKALNAATKHIELMRIKKGIKMSAASTVSLFSTSLKAVGFGYVADGVKVLSLLDKAQEDGGDADDFAKAIAQYAFDKGSGKLLDKAKNDNPGLFDGETMSGEALEKLADMAKSESGKFFEKLLKPKKESLFEITSKNGNCTVIYIGEIDSDKNGPVLVLKVGISCSKCPPGLIRPLKNAMVRYDIPLVLTKNPNAWPMNSKKRLFSWLVNVPPDYIFTPNMKATSVKIAAECCDGNENAYYMEPMKTSEDLYITTNVGFGLDLKGDYKGYNFEPDIGISKELGNGAHNIGLDINGLVSGNGGPSYQSRSNGVGAELFYQKNFDICFSEEKVIPNIRITAPFQYASNASKSQDTEWAKNDNTLNVGAYITPGLTLKADRFAVNLGVNILSLSGVGRKPIGGTSYKPFSNSVNVGSNNQLFKVDLMWKVGRGF